LAASCLCAYRARQQGYSASMFASLGLLVGPGAYPLTWLATTENLKEGPSGHTGLSAELGSLPEVDVRQLQEWGRFYSGWRQISILMIFGLCGGLLNGAGQTLCQLAPYLIPETAADYNSHSNPALASQQLVKAIWVNLMLLGPALAYLVGQKIMRFPSMERLWILYGFQAAGENWRLMVPEQFRHLPDPQADELTQLRPLRDAWNHRVLSFQPILILEFILLFLVAAIGALAACLPAYGWLLRH